MKLHRTSRSVVAVMTTLLFLLCHTAVAAQARANGVATYAGTPTESPCHQSADASHNAPHEPAKLSSCCDAPASVAADFKPDMVAVTDLPGLPVSFTHVPRKAVPLAGAETQAVCYSPPRLTLLHCRLLN